MNSEEQQKNREEMIPKINLAVNLQTISKDYSKLWILILIYGVVLAAFAALAPNAAVVGALGMTAVGYLQYGKEKEFQKKLSDKYGV